MADERSSRVVPPDSHAGQLPDHGLHALRHTSATLLLSAGASPKIVQERLGHSSIKITMDVYSHSRAGMDKAATGTL